MKASRDKEKENSRPTKSFTHVQQWFAKLSNEDSARSLKEASEALKPDTKYEIKDEEGFKGNFKWRTTDNDGIKFRLKVHAESRRQAVTTITMPFGQSGFTESYQRNPVYKGEDAKDAPGDNKYRFRVSQSGENDYNTIDIRGPAKENSTVSLTGDGGERKSVYKGFRFFISDEYKFGKELKIHVKTEEA